MAAPADCVIVTRFNLPTPGVESLVRAQDGWLRNRADLFLRYCLPSVVAQRSRAFTWLIYLDPQSPQWLRDRLAPHIDAGVFVPLYRETATAADLAADAHAHVPGDRSAALLTANLDNDDAIAVDFVDRLLTASRSVGAADAGASSSAIFFGNGLIRDGDGLYLRHDPSNAFRAVCEPWTPGGRDTPRTCWADWHTRLGRHMPVAVLDGAPGWLQVIHGQNVSNRVRGRLVAPSRYHSMFPGVLDDLAEPDTRARARDALVDRPVRLARDAARAGVKNAALAVLGKQRFDQAKHAAGRVRAMAGGRGDGGRGDGA